MFDSPLSKPRARWRSKAQQSIRVSSPSSSVAEIWSGMLVLRGRWSPTPMRWVKTGHSIRWSSCPGSGRLWTTHVRRNLHVQRRIAASVPSLAKKYTTMGRELQAELEDALGDDGVLLHPPYNRPAPRHWDAFRTPFVPAYTAVFNVMEFVTQGSRRLLPEEGLPLGVRWPPLADTIT